MASAQAFPLVSDEVSGGLSARAQARRGAGLLALSGLLTGCGGGGGSSPAGVLSPPLTVSARMADGLTATLSEDHATVPVGGNVAYTFTLTNHTTQPITYIAVSYANAPVAATSNSLEIVDAAGVTTFSAGGPSGPPQDGLSFTLAPGASSPSGISIDAGAFPTTGEYTATAVFRLRTAPGSAVQTTTVGPVAVAAQ